MRRVRARLPGADRDEVEDGEGGGGRGGHLLDNVAEGAVIPRSAAGERHGRRVPLGHEVEFEGVAVTCLGIGRLDLAIGLGEPEVDELHLAVLRQQNIWRRDVAMDQTHILIIRSATVMRILKSGKQLAH